MMNSSVTLFAEGVTRTTFEFMRIQTNTDYIAPVGVVVLIGLYIRYMYRRDAVEISPLVGWLLTALRTCAFLGLLILYLQPHWRVEREEVRNSRVAVLVDTSLSMGLTDGESESAGGAARSQQAASALSETELLDKLREKHDVVVYRFGEDLAKLETLPKLTDDDRPEGEEPKAGDDKKIDWNKALLPTGAETRMGQWLRQVIREEVASRLSGVILFSDGGQNAGVGADAAIEVARDAEASVVAVGVGSDKQPVNVRISDMVAPALAYPGDHYTVTGFIQARGLAGKVVDVQLLSRSAGDGSAKPGSGTIEESRSITLGADGEVVPVKFELSPEEAGRRTLCLRIVAPSARIRTPTTTREVDVEIVDRENRVLLFAGGPVREYRFLRPMLFRDESTIVDVFLQSGQVGMSQEADTILDEFPTTAKELFEYDCIVAFDPDWQELSMEQIDLLERWVAEGGGGLIVVPGPIFAGDSVEGWVNSPEFEKIRTLYPVQFPRRFSVFKGGMISSKEAWPVDFSREGEEAEFLWLDDTEGSSKRAWAEFDGVYSYYPVRGLKPGAILFGSVADPAMQEGDALPVYFAEHLYGAGRVFYMGSNEMWRLRRVEVPFFDQFYTKLIRHVSERRLLRGSSRGVMLADRDRYLLGDTVLVTAQLKNSELEPLEMPSVSMQVIRPDGDMQTIELKRDLAREGNFAGQFAAGMEGTYRLELTVPESENQRLVRRVQVRVPDLERENPQRNDDLLARIADQTGGNYIVGVSGLMAQPVEGKTSDLDTLVASFKDRTKTIFRPAEPDVEWERNWLRWAMCIIVGLLCFEWLIRRLFKLA